MDGHVAAGTTTTFGDDSGDCLKERFPCYVRRGAGRDLGGGLVVAVAATASDAASGVRRAASELGRSLRRGESFGGRHLRPVAVLARKVAPLARASGPLTVAVVVVSIARGESPARAVVRGIGAVAGAAGGAAVCGVVAAGTSGAGALTCIVAVPAFGVSGDRLAARLYDRIERATTRSTRGTSTRARR